MEGKTRRNGARVCDFSLDRHGGEKFKKVFSEYNSQFDHLCLVFLAVTVVAVVS